MFGAIGIAKEQESEENPGGYERRVILNPGDVRKLVDAGCRVSVQASAGEGLGFGDESYLSAGASIEDHDTLYANKDLVLKYKGPSPRNVAALTAGTTIMCMAHLGSLPRRRESLERAAVKVIAMEAIREWRKPLPCVWLGSAEITSQYLKKLAVPMADTVFLFLGLGERLVGAFQYLARAQPAQLFVLPDLNMGRLEGLATPHALVIVTDSSDARMDPRMKKDLLDLGVKLLDVAAIGDADYERLLYLACVAHQPPEFGKRRIHCLHETGYCGAAYGLKLTMQESRMIKSPEDATAVVLGYGNVALGAIDALLESGIGLIRVMTRADLNQPRLSPWFKRADIVVCGAEQDQRNRGKIFYVSNKNIAEDLRLGTAVIDLIGGTALNRCPVEALSQTTFLPDIHFIQNDVFVGGLWGWDQVGKTIESAATYSRQTTEVLLGEERLIEGLGKAAPGVKPAIAIGPV